MYQHAAVLVLQAAVPSTHAFITKYDMEQAVFKKRNHSVLRNHAKEYKPNPSNSESSFSPSECLRGRINLGVFIVFYRIT